MHPSRKIHVRKWVIVILILCTISVMSLSLYVILHQRNTQTQQTNESSNVNIVTADSKVTTPKPKPRLKIAKNEIIAIPLTDKEFAPYGQVIHAKSKGGQSINDNTGKRYNYIAKLSNPKRGKANMSFIRINPLQTPIKLDYLERHVYTNQMFSPMSASRYFVIVCLGEKAPDLSTLKVFMATGKQGVNYNIGTWHFMLTALDQVSDFTSFMYYYKNSDGTELYDVSSYDIAVYDQ
jgi:ureidoglycolate lyase